MITAEEMEPASHVNVKAGRLTVPRCCSAFSWW